MTQKQPLSSPARHALTKLGEDLSRARRRRRITQNSLAERSGVSLATIKRLESGDGRVAIETLVRVLQVLGDLQRIEQLLDTGHDELGLVLMDESLPQRVRSRGGSGAL
jgi:transcriptional regulator with XRE-family HTH domain